MTCAPGEDPRDFGRRRDVWLMPHSLKVAARMLMCEFESASVLVLRRQRVAVRGPLQTQYKGRHDAMRAKVVNTLTSFIAR
mmetsp:Transcript_6003/g.14867  ORF Transcript_6003/g.14867 Transcript_6003/m.14867 type:complete len:81 (-) Transcript_6003:135-377(-)